MENGLTPSSTSEDLEIKVQVSDAISEQSRIHLPMPLSMDKNPATS